jgi:RNA polymerase sigma-70 factor (ECF subfamily)
MDRDSELETVRRLRTGDTDAFDTVHAAFNVRLYRFLARLTGSRDAAEDLLEETWLRLVTHAPQLDAETRLGPWLFTVARNLHLTYCRARAVESRATATLGLFPTAVQESPFQATAGNELQRRLEAAMATLPIDAREVLLLVGVEGMTPSEAAAVCGVRPEAMRQRLKRARALLAQRLADPEPEPAFGLNEVRS